MSVRVVHSHTMHASMFLFCLCGRLSVRIGTAHVVAVFLSRGSRGGTVILLIFVCAVVTLLVSTHVQCFSAFLPSRIRPSFCLDEIVHIAPIVFMCSNVLADTLASKCVLSGVSACVLVESGRCVVGENQRAHNAKIAPYADPSIRASSANSSSRAEAVDEVECRAASTMQTFAVSTTASSMSRNTARECAACVAEDDRRVAVS